MSSFTTYTETPTKHAVSEYDATWLFYIELNNKWSCQDIPYYGATPMIYKDVSGAGARAFRIELDWGEVDA